MEGLGGETVAGGGFRQVDHLERLFDQAAHERGDGGVLAGLGDGVAPGQEAEIGERGMGSVEQPELPPLERFDVVGAAPPRPRRAVAGCPLGDGRRPAALARDGGQVAQAEAFGDVVEVGGGGRRHHAVDDRADERHDVGRSSRARSGSSCSGAARTWRRRSEPLSSRLSSGATTAATVRSRARPWATTVGAERGTPVVSSGSSW